MDTPHTDLEAILERKKTAIAKAINLLENRRPASIEHAKKLLDKLSRNARPQRHVIGITGPPGAGKSSLISRLIPEYRSQGKTIGILSVDPSSRKSGGALLGDRVRIVHDPTDEGVFIRSMAAGTHLGGLAWQTRHCLMVFESVFDIILLETVGVGQSETEIDQVADSIVFVVQPGSGDTLQFMKSGIMEIPHILLVNKADQKVLAQRTLNDLKTVENLKSSSDTDWQLELLHASALEGWGQKELVQILETHRRFLLRTGIDDTRHRHRCQWVVALFNERFGSFGTEILGGEKRVLQMITETDTTNPFRSLAELEGRLRKELGLGIGR